jgi:hypothetical protein
MNLFESIKLLVGKVGPGRSDTPGPATGSECPHEADILAYSEDRLSQRRREQLEGHFLCCDDCRAFLALFAHSCDDATEPDIRPLTDKAIKNQTARVLTYIKEDEFNRRKAEGNKQPVEAMGGGLFTFNRQGGATRSFTSSRQMAGITLMICAVAVGTLYFTMGSEPPIVIAKDAFTLAVKDNRFIEPQLPGLPHSPYNVENRGDGKDGDGKDAVPPRAGLQFRRAEVAIQFAEDPSAPAEPRLLLARIYLAHGDPDHTGRALTILEQLAAAGNQSPEFLNDMGVALYQSKRYSEALSYFDQALDKSPGFNEALFNRALTEKKMGNLEKAREDWNRFIESSADEKWKDEARNNLRLMR